MSRVGDTAHVEFKGLKTWPYEVSRSDDKVVLTIPAIDDASLAAITTYADPLVKGVEVNRNGPDGTYQITFKLAGRDIESFDYLTDEPSRLILDFYQKAEAPKSEKLAEVAPAKKSADSPEVGSKVGGLKVPKKVARAAAKKDPTRKPASDEILQVAGPGATASGDPLEATEDNPAAEKMTPTTLRYGIFDGGDDNYDRFRVKDYEIREDAIVASRQNIYLPFPMLKMPISSLEELMADRPEYVIRPTDSRENQEARLLVTLHNRGRSAIFLTTYDYFVKKYPESPYMEILKNISADIHLEQWRKESNNRAFEVARGLYTELIEKYPQSPLRERNHLLLAYAMLERGEALSTLQLMQSFVARFPNSKEVPQLRKGMADALITFRKYDEAIDQYKAMMRDYPKTSHFYEAEFRLGDVFFSKGDYGQAIQTYEAAIKRYPDQEKVFPNADFNLAEAQFWQRDYKKALNQYITFVRHFPRHPFGGYALTRVGEIMGIFGVDQRRMMGALIESYFRFPTNPGAQVARIRMLSQQMKGMKEKEVKKALEEIETIARSSKLPGMEEFKSLMIADGLQGRGEFIGPLEQLIAYYQKNPASLNLDSFRTRILRNIANEIKARVDRGEFMKALEFFSKYSNTWLKNADRIDIPYFVANSYEAAGAFDEAHRLYTESLERRRAILGTEREKERRVHENLPSVESLNLRLAATNFASRLYMPALEHLKATGDGKGLAPKEQIERVELAAQIHEQRNDTQKAREALTELTNHWKGDPQLLASVFGRLASIDFKAGDFKSAEANASKVIGLDSKDSPLPDKLIARAYQTKGEALVGQKKSMAAVEVFQSLLEKYEEKLPLGLTRYQLGKILFDRGDMKGAEAVWRRLAGTANDVLWKMGEEKLKATSWQDEYNKYIDRIPAMVNDKKQESSQ